MVTKARRQTAAFCLSRGPHRMLTFTHKDVREHLAPLLGKKPTQLSPGQITYDLRRLRLHDLTKRIPKTHRYRITAKGLRTAIFYTGLYNRSLRTGLAIIAPDAANPELPMAKSIRQVVNQGH